MAAIALMQKNPNEAMARFKNDEDVTIFLQEFGKVMGSHFEAIGGNSGSTNQQSSSSEALKPVQEIGPLHAEAISKSKANKRLVYIYKFM
jgi:hypothetical protein